MRRATISDIRSGTPSVVSALGELTDQPLKLDSTDGEGDQVQFDFRDADLPEVTAYVVELDVLIQSNSHNKNFQLIFDTDTTTLNLAFRNGRVWALTTTASEPAELSDVAGYDAHIDHATLYHELAELIPGEKYLLRLLWQYLRHSVEDGGEYRDIEQGIARCLFSAISAAIPSIRLMSTSYSTQSSTNGSKSTKR